MPARPGAPGGRSARDAGLRRVAKLTRWSLAGALTGTGLFAGLAAQVGRGAAASSTTKHLRQTATSGAARAAPASARAGSAGSSATTTPTPATPATPGTAAAPAPYVAPVTSSGPISIVSGAS